MWVSAPAGMAFMVRGASAPGMVALVPLLVAMTQYLAVVVVYPKGERLILPVHTLLVPYAAIAAHAVWRRIAPRPR